MNLARRALTSTLAVLMLCVAASAQTLRFEEDPRNIAPTVGTGGPVGGPTGLFTVYDGQTLRRGEFTFSFAYSNFDRDPGNADFVEIPVSFQIGLSDYLELFFNTDAYRGVKVNSPRNLSGFLLPNVGISGTSNGRFDAAITQRALGGVAGPSVIFRPANTQPFVAFPFIGGRTQTNIPLFTIGATRSSNSGTFDAADNFPGLGAPVGGILPGLVFASNANGVPTVFTLAPAYLPDAPFLSRRYGESSFSTFTVGGKIRFTETDNPVGLGLIPFYRFYADKADDASGFNQLQRGASPGGDIGDFGLIGFFDARVSKRVNLSTNLGYILNSNPKINAAGGEFTILDRPNELLVAAAVDFPINKHFQPIAEIRATRYVGGRTPNALENHPVDALFGVRIFPRRYLGLSFAYRIHLNQQDGELDGNTGGIGGIGAGGRIPGFVDSTDPHGFIAQFFIGRRNERVTPPPPNTAPTVNLRADRDRVTVCAIDPSRATNPQVQLTATATDPENDTLLYTYTTTGGRVVGTGSNVTLDLTGAQPGTYTTSVEVNDGRGCVAFSSTTVTVEECPIVTVPCPTVTVSCPDTFTANSPITFTANVSGGDTAVSPTFTWTVSAGTISSGQGTSSISVDTAGLGGQAVTATVDVGGYAADCPRSASCTSSAPPVQTARKIDEYGNLVFNDEKARLDAFAIELQNDPQARGVYIVYGGRTTRTGEADLRAERARDYLVNTRGIDASRISTVNGGFREDLGVELYVVPAGATEPTASPTVDASEVRPAPARRAGRRGRRGRDDE